VNRATGGKPAKEKQTISCSENDETHDGVDSTKVNVFQD
jgi:hypothetical protein